MVLPLHARCAGVLGVRRYHDEATFGYRVPVKYTLPDCEHHLRSALYLGPS